MKNNKEAKIKAPYDKSIEIAEHLFNEFKKELSRTTTGWNDKKYRATRRSRLNRLRVELNSILLDVEKNYEINYCEEV